jgi:hypothetical protein
MPHSGKSVVFLIHTVNLIICSKKYYLKTIKMANKKAFAFLLQRLSLYSVGIFLPEMILDVLKKMPQITVYAFVVAA